MTRVESPIARRRLVLAAIGACLVAAALAVRAAAFWAASSAPLEIVPVSADSVEAALAAERDRSAALASEMVALAVRAEELDAALDAALQRVAADAETADALRAKLAAAERKLKRLQASIEASAARPTAGSAQGSGASGGRSDHDNDGEEGDDD